MILIALPIVPKGSVDIKSAFVQVMLGATQATCNFLN